MVIKEPEEGLGKPREVGVVGLERCHKKESEMKSDVKGKALRIRKGDK